MFAVSGTFTKKPLFAHSLGLFPYFYHQAFGVYFFSHITIFDFTVAVKDLQVVVRFLYLERDLSSPQAIKIRANWLERRLGLCGEAVCEVTLGQKNMRRAERGGLPQLQGGEEGVRRVNKI